MENGVNKWWNGKLEEKNVKKKILENDLKLVNQHSV